MDASRPAHRPILSRITRYRSAGVRLGSLLAPQADRQRLARDR